MRRGPQTSSHVTAASVSTANTDVSIRIRGPNCEHRLIYVRKTMYYSMNDYRYHEILHETHNNQ